MKTHRYARWGGLAAVQKCQCLCMLLVAMYFGIDDEFTLVNSKQVVSNAGEKPKRKLGSRFRVETDSTAGLASGLFDQVELNISATVGATAGVPPVRASRRRGL
jgi:hypothetical protein